MTSIIPAINKNGIVGKYIFYPDLTGKRGSEGGLRATGQFKHSMPGMPLVSIVTVCLNSEKTLEHCMQSVLQQTFENIEYIVIDGGSTDGTLELIKKYEKTIDYFLSEPDRGLYHAMNKGLKMASGDFILILNSDDWYAEDCVEALVKAKKDSGADFVSALAKSVDQSGKSLQVIRSMPYDDAIRLRMPLRHETMLLSTAIYNELGAYDEQYRIIADFHLTLRIFEKGYSHYEVPRPLMFFRNTGVSSTNMNKLFIDREKILAQQFPFMDIADVRILAEHGKLDPYILELLLIKYNDQFGLHAALKSFVLDQKNVGAVRWKIIDMSIFTDIDKFNSCGSNLSPKQSGLKVATFCSMDHGGAGVGTQRRVEALRHYGLDAQIFSLVVKSTHSYVNRIIPKLPNIDVSDQMAVWNEVRKQALQPVRAVKGFMARELFSLTDSVINFRDLKEIIDESDVIHLHWVVGIFDYEHAGDVLAEKPVVWTLADMNAFTGGCHYSEGCEQYKFECQRCHLLGGKSDLAHKTWQRKKAAYQKLNNLHIICPSRWIYDRVKRSSLLGNKKIHYIPNAFPVDRFIATNKLVARIKLGLPVNKKLLLFGADALNNERKGGAQLKLTMELLSKTTGYEDVEVVVFGNSSIHLPMYVHSLGHISDDARLALAYSAADVFLSPSLEDSGPMTVGEALCCGTPVVAFSVGYATEAIEHTVNGYIAKNFNCDDFAHGIKWALDLKTMDALRRSILCRRGGVSFHEPQIAVERHLAVYHAAIGNL